MEAGRLSPAPPEPPDRALGRKDSELPLAAAVHGGLIGLSLGSREPNVRRQVIWPRTVISPLARGHKAAWQEGNAIAASKSGRQEWLK